MRLAVVGLFASLAGCAGGDVLDCRVDEQIDAWADEDGDGFGAGERLTVCKLGEQQVDNVLDCDDADPAVHPGAEEVCNGRDDDCNGEIDNGFQTRTYYRDGDGDGFGVRFPAQVACAAPGEGWVTNADDCDDAHADRHPGAAEVCNGGIDDDCDGRADDADDSLLVSSTTRWFRDADADGHGNGNAELRMCVRPAGHVDNERDCDDSRSTVYPGAPEIPSNGVDENCNGLEGCFHDADGDGARAETWDELDDPRCETEGYAPRAWPVDCDDSDPAVNIVVDWYVDGDGVGAGLPVATSCLHPGGPLVAQTPQLDCDDDDELVYPGAIDVCNDGFDTNCDARDTCASCKDWYYASDTPVDGVYPVEPAPGALFDVWCDMTTDGGGWTLVASTTGVTLDDAASAWYDDLTTVTPASGHFGVWAGMRPVTAEIRHDVRFACKLSPGAASMTVDLSFYQVPWYNIITTGTDAQSCFNDSSGAGQTPAVPPMRRDNVSGAVRPEGDQWDWGYLESEDYCGDTSDFTIDFDDRGMDSDQGDGTDWGEDDGAMKCGTTTAIGGAWFVFVRE